MDGEIQNARQIDVAVCSLSVFTTFDDGFPAAACDVTPGVFKALAGADLCGNQNIVVQK